MDYSVRDHHPVLVPEEMRRALHGLTPSELAEAELFSSLSVRRKRITDACARLAQIARLIRASFRGSQRLRVPEDGELYQTIRENLLIDLEEGGFADARDQAIDLLPSRFTDVREDILESGVRSIYRLVDDLTRLRIDEGGMSPNLALLNIRFMHEIAEIEAIEQEAQFRHVCDIALGRAPRRATPDPGRVELQGVERLPAPALQSLPADQQRQAKQFPQRRVMQWRDEYKKECGADLVSQQRFVDWLDKKEQRQEIETAPSISTIRNLSAEIGNWPTWWTYPISSLS